MKWIERQIRAFLVKCVFEALDKWESGRGQRHVQETIQYLKEKRRKIEMESRWRRTQFAWQHLAGEVKPTRTQDLKNLLHDNQAEALPIPIKEAE